jgi:pimeloyl-ACP methyl ester carboxylesterase
VRKRKKVLLWLFLVLAAAAGVWLALPPRPVRIDLDIQVGEDVRISTPEGSLAGSLLRPASGAAPAPAVVMITGSGSYSYRKALQPEVPTHWKAAAETFLEKGWTVLFLEKRGVNGSEGSWSRQSFADRADDAVAGVRYLKSRSDVNPQQVGLCGHSQGGWIVQLAASLYPDEVAFIISLAGPNTSVRQQIIDDLVNEWRCAGIGEGSILKKEKRLRTKFGLYAGLSRVVKIGYLSRIIDYDPVNIGARIRCPILALYGEHDTLVLPETNIPLLRAGLGQGGNVNFRIVTIPGAGHGFHRIPGKCPDWDKIEETIAPELRAELAAWDPFSNSPPGS